MRRKTLIFAFMLVAGSALGQTNFPVSFLSDLSRVSRDEAKIQGQLAAANDFSNGVYRVETYGFAACVMTKQQTYLREHYNVEIWPVAGCVVSSGLLGYVDGYNGRMKELLIQKCGHDIFEEADKAVLVSP